MAHQHRMNIVRRWRWLGIGLLWIAVLNGCGILHPSSPPPCAPVAHTSGSYAGDAGVVQSLQRQIKEREQRIAELESQLDVLKAIDQDMEKRRKPSRPPATLMPAE